MAVWSDCPGLVSKRLRQNNTSTICDRDHSVWHLRFAYQIRYRYFDKNFLTANGTLYGFQKCYRRVCFQT